LSQGLVCPPFLSRSLHFAPCALNITPCPWCLLLMFRPFPKRPCLSHFHQSPDKLPAIFSTARDPVRVQAPAKIVAREDLEQVRQGKNTVLGGRVETGPFADMLFRPEEVHGLSSIGGIFRPPPKRHGHIGLQALGFSPQNASISNLDSYGEPAI